MADDTSRKGSSYATPQLLQYVERTHAQHDAALQRAFTSPEKNGLPAIQLGVSEGKLLELLCRLAGARRVVEVGTLCGYSAIRIARTLGESGQLFTLEKEPKNAAVARDNIAQAGLSQVVEVVEGAAVDTLPTLNTYGPFDLVFIDADKGNYDRYGQWAEENLRPGGILVGDNAYLFGDLLSDKPEAAAMRRFHERCAAHFDSVCVPTPDGMVIGIRR